MSKTTLQFAHHPHPSPVPADKRAELLKNPGFGRVFSDHMVTIRYHESKGWYDARIEPRAPDITCCTRQKDPHAGSPAGRARVGRIS